MSFMQTYRRAPFRIGLVIALVAGSALGLKGANAEHRAHLSLDLLAHQSRHTAARARVIVHGSAASMHSPAATICRSFAGSPAVRSSPPAATN